MSELHVSLDPASLDATGRKLRDPLEEQLSSALQAGAERVRAEYAGEPVDTVAAMILAEAKAGLHPDVAAGFTPDPAQLREIAAAVIDASRQAR